MKKKINYMFARMAVVGFFLLLQIAVLIIIIWKLTTYFVYFYIFSMLLSIITVIYLISKNDNPSYKLAWAIPILLFPLFGGFFYIITGNNNRMNARLQREVGRIYRYTIPYLGQNEEVIKELEEDDLRIASQAKYLRNYSFFPVYKNTSTKYLSPGEIFFKHLLEELEKAKNYIFLEYFIIQEGIMWDSVLDVLIRKVREGVDVRLIYDDIGCLQTVPYRYNEKLEKLGIKCRVFNPISPVLTIFMNNRDHRKLTIIDGHTGFLGGINLADEYINEFERYGHWKDAGMLLKGEAVWNLTIMFFQNWAFNTNVVENYIKYKPSIVVDENFKDRGYVQPFGDSPLDHENVGENVYLNVLYKAKKYVYITTPYLVVDNEMATALMLVAKSGIDVRIITPHIEDKWYVHIVTRSYYPQLIEAGVKIYEYTPGFIHAKTFVSDDEIGVVGSINMDYRSLYLHFESATWLYKTESVLEVKEDFLKTLEVCTVITLDECNKIGLWKRLLRAILRLFAPLM